MPIPRALHEAPRTLRAMKTNQDTPKHEDDARQNEHGKQEKKHQAPGTSGYPEPQPTPAHKHQQMPGPQTPHEPQNNPEQKPTRQSS